MHVPDTLLGTAAVCQILDEYMRMVTAEMSSWKTTVLLNLGWIYYLANPLFPEKTSFPQFISLYLICVPQSYSDSLGVLLYGFIKLIIYQYCLSNKSIWLKTNIQTNLTAHFPWSFRGNHHCGNDSWHFSSENLKARSWAEFGLKLDIA